MSQEDQIRLQKIDDSCVGAGKSESELLTPSPTFLACLSDLPNSFCKCLIHFLEPSKFDLGVSDARLALAFGQTVCTKTTTRDKFDPCYSPAQVVFLPDGTEINILRTDRISKPSRKSNSGRSKVCGQK